MAKSKFFRVLAEGNTIDGRTVTREMVQQLADGFNPSTYGVRVNMEHLRSVLPDGPFKMLGDVTAVRAQEDTIEINGKGEKRLCLYAQIEPLPALVELVKGRQKIYTSVEISPDFARTGKAGLIGLAVTDSPASLATEALQFVAARKVDPANLFSPGAETVIEFEAEPQPQGGGLLAALQELFASTVKGVSPPASPPPPPATPPATTDTNAALFSQGLALLAAQTDARLTQQGAALAELVTNQAKLTTAVTELTQKLTATPAGTPRPIQTGDTTSGARTDF